MAMTVQALSQYRAICREIPDIKERVRASKRKLAGHQEVKASMAEFPYTPYALSIDRVSREDEQETLRLMQRRLRRITRQRREIERYIDDIRDSQLRQVFHLRFVDGLSWEGVSIKIGGGNSAEGLKKQVYRHLQSVPKVPKNGAILEV